MEKSKIVREKFLIKSASQNKTTEKSKIIHEESFFLPAFQYDTRSKNEFVHEHLGISVEIKNRPMLYTGFLVRLGRWEIDTVRIAKQRATA